MARSLAQGSPICRCPVSPSAAFNTPSAWRSGVGSRSAESIRTRGCATSHPVEAKTPPGRSPALLELSRRASGSETAGGLAGAAERRAARGRPGPLADGQTGVAEISPRRWLALLPQTRVEQVDQAHAGMLQACLHERRVHADVGRVDGHNPLRLPSVDVSLPGAYMHLLPVRKQYWTDCNGDQERLVRPAHEGG